MLYVITNTIYDITDISDIPHLTRQEVLPINFSFWCRYELSNFSSENRITAAFVDLAIRLSSSIYGNKLLIMS